MVRPNFFLMNVFFALKGSKNFIIITIVSVKENVEKDKVFGIEWDITGCLYSFLEIYIACKIENDRKYIKT